MLLSYLVNNTFMFLNIARIWVNNFIHYCYNMEKIWSGNSRGWLIIVWLIIRKHCLIECQCSGLGLWLLKTILTQLKWVCAPCPSEVLRYPDTYPSPMIHRVCQSVITVQTSPSIFMVGEVSTHTTSYASSVILHDNSRSDWLNC